MLFVDGFGRDVTKTGDGTVCLFDDGMQIEAVVRRLLWVKSKDADAKVLIFSTWHEVLDVVEHALSINKITFARVKGTK